MPWMVPHDMDLDIMAAAVQKFLYCFLFPCSDDWVQVSWEEMTHLEVEGGEEAPDKRIEKTEERKETG